MRAAVGNLTFSSFSPLVKHWRDLAHTGARGGLRLKVVTMQVPRHGAAEGRGAPQRRVGAFAQEDLHLHAQVQGPHSANEKVVSACGVTLLSQRRVVLPFVTVDSNANSGADSGVDSLETTNEFQFT